MRWDILYVGKVVINGEGEIALATAKIADAYAVLGKLVLNVTDKLQEAVDLSEL